MASELNRRQFLGKSTVSGLLGTAAAARLQLHSGRAFAATAPYANGPFKKAACIGVFPRELTVLQKFQLARKVGFEGIEPNTIETPEEEEQFKAAAQDTGVKIHSIMNSDHWKYPLTDDDPEVVEKCVEGVRRSMRNAHALGAGVVLLVPGIVTPLVPYSAVYRRSQEQIRKLLPLAQELGVIIAVENVGNRFLLSPLEFARYVDEFESPFVRAYFDVGNVTSYGYPQDWIRTLGSRLVRIHIKKFEPGVDHPRFDPKDRRTQGIDWPDVQRALKEAGYASWISAEVKAGDESYLAELSARVDRIFAGEDPV